MVFRVEPAHTMQEALEFEGDAQEAGIITDLQLESGFAAPGGQEIDPADVARLSPLGHPTINLQGRYRTTSRAPDVGLRPLRPPDLVTEHRHRRGRPRASWSGRPEPDGPITLRKPIRSPARSGSCTDPRHRPVGFSA